MNDIKVILSQCFAEETIGVRFVHDPNGPDYYKCPECWRTKYARPEKADDLHITSVEHTSDCKLWKLYNLVKES